MVRPTRPEISLYHRNAARITGENVLHALEKQAAIETLPFFKRKKARLELEAKWVEVEARAAHEAAGVLKSLKDAAEALRDAFAELASLKVPELLGKVEGEEQRVRSALTQISSAYDALSHGDFSTAGSMADEAARGLWLIGGPLVVSVNQVLAKAAIGKEHRAQLERNVVERQAAKAELELVRRRDGLVAAVAAAGRVHRLEATGFKLAAEILKSQTKAVTHRKVRLGREGETQIIPPQELETFDDVGGLEDVKDQLRATVGAILERPDQAARYRVVHNGILFHGPPGSGKTLLSRALAGEYGLRYIRFSPASIASAYLHEAAANLQRLFQTAADNTPCLLFLDEIDTIASAREDQPSADHREVVTQLMSSLEEYRGVHGLVIVAATNSIDRLDPGLREGRFDSKIQ